jgi:hypothetical protein
MRLWQLSVAVIVVGSAFLWGVTQIPGLTVPKSVRNGCAHETVRSADPMDIVNQVCR